MTSRSTAVRFPWWRPKRRWESLPRGFFVETVRPVDEQAGGDASNPVVSTGDLIPRRPHLDNPFYVVLVVAGVLFVLSAIVCSAEIVHSLRSDPSGDDRQTWLLKMARLHGGSILVIELAALVLGSIGAVWWDNRRRKALGDHRESTASDVGSSQHPPPQ